MLIDKFPFAAYYKIYKDMVVVFSVLDTRMDPGTINSRLDSLS